MITHKSAFEDLILRFSESFTKPSFDNFKTIVEGWILTPGRKTMTNIIQSADAVERKHFSAYYRFFSRAVWSSEEVAEQSSRLAVESLSEDEKTLYTAGDDTLYHKVGKKIAGAGLFRDAVLSTKKNVSRWGLNFVTFGLTVKPQADGPYLCLPVLAGLHQKGKNTPAEIMAEKLEVFAGWFPDREIRHAVDGYYSNKTVICRLPKNVHLTGRIRCDAVLYEMPVEVKRPRRGRPRKHGKRLPAPRDWADWERLNWRETEVMAYKEKKKVLVKQKTAFWYRVGKGRPLNILLVRDPEGKWRDEYFFTTDVVATAEKILEEIIRRNAIEPMHKDSKQIMGVHEGQSRLPLAVERQIPFGIGLMTLIIVWYLKYGQGSKDDLIPRLPWYAQKDHACFMDMLACLRRTLWRKRFFANSTLPAEMQKIIHPLIEALAKAS